MSVNWAEKPTNEQAEAQLRHWVADTQRCDVCNRTAGRSLYPAAMLGMDGEVQDVLVCRSCADVLIPDVGQVLEVYGKPGRADT